MMVEFSLIISIILSSNLIFWGLNYRMQNILKRNLYEVSFVSYPLKDIPNFISLIKAEDDVKIKSKYIFILLGHTISIISSITLIVLYISLKNQS